MKLIYSMSWCQTHNVILNDAGVKERLISYWFCRTNSSLDLRKLAKDGTWDKPERKTKSRKAQTK